MCSSPVNQAAVAGDVETNIVMQFFENVHQRRRRGHAGLHGESQPVGLAFFMVRILPDNHDAHILISSVAQRIEDSRSRGINGSFAALFANKMVKRLVIGLLLFVS